MNEDGLGRESWKCKPITNISTPRESQGRGNIRQKLTSAELYKKHKLLAINGLKETSSRLSEEVCSYKIWPPVGDSNPCYWNENPVSWTWLDEREKIDYGVEATPVAPMCKFFFLILQKNERFSSGRQKKRFQKRARKLLKPLRVSIL